MKQVNELTETEARELLRDYQKYAQEVISYNVAMQLYELHHIANLEPLTLTPMTTDVE